MMGSRGESDALAAKRDIRISKIAGMVDSFRQNRLFARGQVGFVYETVQYRENALPGYVRTG
jgi:hypothetical protein